MSILERPIVLAPMAGFGPVELAATVAGAGRLGSIAMNPHFAVETIAAMTGWPSSIGRLSTQTVKGT